MITRLYVNNFRCLVNFKAEFDSFAVLCGPNGAGKSSVFDALRLLRNLGTGDALLGGTGEQDVPRLEFPRWDDKATTQQFELSLSADGHSFDYLLHIEQKADFEKPRIILENAALRRLSVIRARFGRSASTASGRKRGRFSTRLAPGRACCNPATRKHRKTCPPAGGDRQAFHSASQSSLDGTREQVGGAVPRSVDGQSHVVVSLAVSG